MSEEASGVGSDPARTPAASAGARHRAGRTRVVALVAALSTLILPVGAANAAHASGQAPAITALTPASGSAAAPGSSLTATVTDPEDSPLTVTFHGAARGTTPSPAGDPFTFVVLPDTQNYALDPANEPRMTAQMNWIVSQRAALDIAYVAGVGDIVDNDLSPTQWGRSTKAMAILDNAGVPSAVLPGNHDYDLVTGDFAPYNQYFPVSRYRDAAWNSADASYGGYYGQDQFGDDPGDRQNMNNYSLFRESGMEFLLISLELNPPDEILAWAKRVIDAFPARRVILATHSYLSLNGAFSLQQLRQDVAGNSGAQIFQKLVYPNCRIFLVVNGHFNNGDLGEAHRTEQNACGQPVHAALTDYQARANGGDGWLRYYTFDPALNQIRASTYSPYLGSYETDSNSQFTLPYDMGGAQADLPQIGTSTVASGATASVAIPSVPQGTVFDWYATVSDGTTTTRGATQTVTVAAPPPGGGTVASDGFSRTTASGWGAADTGGPWTVNAASRFSVGGGTGRIAANAGSTLTGTLAQVSGTALDTHITVAVDRIPNQVLSETLAGRTVGAAAYGARLRFNPNGTLALHLMRDGTALAGNTVPGITYAAGTRLHVRLQVEGTNPTVIRTRVWRDGSAEPTGWQYTATDATAALQQPGSPRISAYLSGSATNGPVTISHDDLTVRALGSSPPPNTAPTAAFTWAADGLTVTADSAPSSDSDGSIVARSWDLAGVAATGATASRTFPAPGTYPVTLTVTDDDGASASTTQSVTVTAAPAPNTAPTAAFTWAADGLTVTVDSAPSTDSDGTIASRTWDLGGTAATGTTASRTFPASGTYPVTLTVTDDDGAAASSTQSVTVTAPPPPGGGTLASDAFARTVASGWGAADAGGTWTVNAAARFSVSGGTGRIAANAGSTLTATLGQVTGSALDTRVVVAADRVPNQVLSITVAGRTVGTSTYGGRVRINPNGSVQLHVMRDGTALAGNTLPGIAYTAGMRLHIRVQVDGTNPTTVRTKVWRDGTAEPGAWQYSATDSSAALQQPGSPRLISYLSSAATNGPVSLTVDDLVVTASG